MKSVQMRSFSGRYFPVFGPEKVPYLDTFHAVQHCELMSFEFKSAM